MKKRVEVLVLVSLVSVLVIFGAGFASANFFDNFWNKVTGRATSSNGNIYGDVDGDGKITTTDALTVAKYASGQITPTDTQKELADVDSDGIISIQDSNLILAKSVGTETRDFPLCYDPDGDGYGNNCDKGSDCNNGDFSVYPGAKEICDNNIDDNCDGSVDEGCSSSVGSGGGGSNANNASCEDSDGGLNYNVKGIVKGSLKGGGGSVSATMGDYCNEGKDYVQYDEGAYLLEYFCEDGYISSKNYKCPSGCAGGACKKESNETNNVTKTVFCKDSDGGLNYSVFGTVESGDCSGDSIQEGCGGETLEDYCQTKSTLMEAGCDSFSNSSFYSSHICKEGFCFKGACMEVKKLNLKSCSDFIDFLDSPYSFKIGSSEFSFIWELIYKNKGERKFGDLINYQVYDAGFRSVYENNYFFWQENMHVKAKEFINENSLKEAKRELKRALDHNLCKLREIGGENVYVCLDPWEVTDRLRNPKSIGDFKYKEVIWISGNKLFNIKTSGEESYCKGESCKLFEEQKHAEEQKDLIEGFKQIKDNEGIYLWDYYLSWKVEETLKTFLGSCSSDINPEESNKSECFSNGWSCKIEPVVCPPHGLQTRTCVRRNFCDEEKTEVRKEEIQCSPGICAGCYVPRWFGYEGDNRCIPYGFRFKQQSGWKIGGVVENRDSDRLRVSEANKYSDVDLEVYPNRTALLTLESEKRVPVSILLEEKKSYDWGRIMGHSLDGLNMTLFVDEIFYDSTNYENSYISVTIRAVGETKEKVPEYFNAYCDIDGRIKKQKTKDLDGNWATCQNNYECESNFCTSGECVEIVDLIKKAKGFKGFFVRLSCRLSSMFGDTKYDNCIYEKLGR